MRCRDLATMVLGLGLAGCRQSSPMKGDHHPMATPSTEATAHAGYREAREALERAETARALGDLDAAQRELDRALSALGEDYAPPGVADDTGLKLGAAADLWKQGRREDAVQTRTRMLRSRLTLYRQRHADAPPEPRRLELELAADPARSKIGDPLKIVLTLKSTGTAPVAVSSRLALNNAYAPDPMRELVFDVIGPDGKLRPFQARINIGHAKPEQVRLLKPGEQLREEVAIDRFFDLREPGDYKITALYSSAPVADASGHPVWTELVYSREIQFSRVP